MTQGSASKRSPLGIALGVVFVLSLIMGPGPGIYLINPNPADPHARLTVFGMPIIYVWAVFWFFVQAAVVVIAYFTVWRDAEDPVVAEGDPA